MKELIRFSVKRRFMNHATLLLNGLLAVIVCGVLFADKIIEVINPSMLDSQVIYADVDERIMASLNETEQQGLEFIAEKRSDELLKEHPKAYVLYYEDGYKLSSQYDVPAEMLQAISAILSNIHQTLTLSEFLTPEEYERFNQSVSVENTVVNASIDMNGDKQSLVFMVITSIYFTMLSFSTSVANEVIYEKSTRQLELILTSVSAKTHFLSKMIVGWLAIVLQALSLAAYVILSAMLRIFYDDGRGLIMFVNKVGLLHIEEETLIDFLLHLPIEANFMIKLCFIFFFLMMGILLLQMILVVISSFIANIEEAGNVQGPFYLILLGVYYFTLSVNSPYQMSEGIGFFCSFLPFLNMLFMPCRLLIQNVDILELCLSALISCVFMALILTKGPKVYQRGVLDYTSRGFLGVMKKAIEREQ